MKKKAEMGIGTLILFIASIFVAATVASVFIQTATSLQNKALDTAKQAQKSVSTRMTFLHISAHDGNEEGIRYFEAKSKLSPGSDTIDLTDSLITLELNDASYDLVYSPESCNNATNSSGDGYFTDPTLMNGTFTVEYLVSSKTDHNHGYMRRDEVVKLCFASGRYILEDEDVGIVFIPKYGSQTSMQLVTPDIMTTKMVKLF